MLEQLTSLVLGIYGSMHLYQLVAAGVIMLIAGLVMTRFAQIVNVTIGALIVFVLVGFVLRFAGVLPGQAPIDQLASGYVNDFLGLTVAAFLVYFIAFAVVTAVIYGVKSAVGSRG